MHPFMHSSIHTVTHSLMHPLMHSSMHPLMYSLIHPPNRSETKVKDKDEKEVHVTMDVSTVNASVFCEVKQIGTDEEEAFREATHAAYLVCNETKHQTLSYRQVG